MSAKKWIYVLRAVGEDHASFAERMRSDVGERLLAFGPQALKLTVTETPPPKLSSFPFRRRPIAMFSIWDSEDEPSRYEQLMKSSAPRVSGYEVEESTPVPYAKTWADGEATPTPILLTLLHKKPGLSDAEYRSRWHGGHTPLSLEIHPLCYYVRNVITAPVTEGADDCDGIVEEACPSRSVLLNPLSFYGGPLRMVPNLLRVAKDILGFLDMRKLEVFYATEYQLRTGSR
jgi:hypothetical protein